ncbi:MAG: serine/threonine-protein kinase PknK, partial [Myxococcales bacterium]|nr:serine/threonine-protein kinase PknK [Myxococcales bacterium]
MRVGAFELDRKIGAGGMGEIWMARHLEQGVPAAVKFDLHPPDDTWREAFLAEVRRIAELDHPNVVHLFDTGLVTAGEARAAGGFIAEGMPWLAMELARGGSVADAGNTPTDWTGLLHLATGLLRALSHAHARGIVHRDLKPANLLICSSHDLRPGLKIADFGLAWATDRDRRGIKRAGTPDTISPEQVRGDPTAFGPWTDLYALGAMVWQWVTGRPPFVGPDLESQLQAHLTADLPPLAPRFPVPDGLEDVLAWLLERETVDRPRSAAAVTRALLGLEKGLGLPAQPLPLPTDWRDREPAPVAQLTNAGMGLLGRREHRVVGRGPEQQAVWAALREVAASRSMRVVALVGEPGIGCSHIARWLERRVVEVGAGEGHRIDVETGLAGFAERALGVVVSGVASLGPHATELDQALFARRANPPSLLVLRWLAERASRGPVVVRVDDAHRAPGATLLADALFERLEGPVLFVATGPLESPVWDDLALHAAFSRIPLGGVPDRAMEELALH